MAGVLLVVIALASVAYDTADRVFVSPYAIEFCAVVTARSDAETLLPDVIEELNTRCVAPADAQTQPARSLTYFEAEPAAAGAWTAVIGAGVLLSGLGLYRLQRHGRWAMVPLCAGAFLLLTWSALFQYGNPSRDYERLLFSSAVAGIGTLSLFVLATFRNSNLRAPAQEMHAKQ
jgi:hypothetical protein